MDSEAINPIRNQDIAVSRPKPVSPASAPPPVSSREKAPTGDTVSLSSEGKQALEGNENPPKAPSGNDTASRPTRNSGQTPDPVTDRQRKFSVTETHDVILKIIDSDTREVVKQIPSEEEMRLKNAIRHTIEGLGQNETNSG